MAQQTGLRAINILPREYRQPLISIRDGVLIAGLFIAAAALIVMAQSYQNERSNTARLESERATLQAQVASAQPRINEASDLKRDIQKLQKDLAQAHALTETLTGRPINWDGLLTELFDKAPSGIQLKSARVEAGSLIVAGVTTQPFGVLAVFVRQISTNPEISQVVVNKMDTNASSGQTVFTLKLDLVNG